MTKKSTDLGIWEEQILTMAGIEYQAISQDSVTSKSSHDIIICNMGRNTSKQANICQYIHLLTAVAQSSHSAFV
jgi:hypothetical protein